MASIYALIVAAGHGSRFGGTIPKQYLTLGDSSVLRHAVAAFAEHPRIGDVLVMIRPEDRALFDHALAGLRIMPPVTGGLTRQGLVRLGLEALASKRPERVLIHDGARPLPDEALINRVIDGLDRAPAAIPCLPLRDTIKRAEDDLIRATIDRSALWRAQTPQGFHFDAVLAAHRAAVGRALTDDAAVAEAAGLAPLMVAGSEDNLKVTTTEDLAAAERLLAARQMDVRVGQGLDAHCFAPGDHVWLCGVRIPNDASLAGHSDADVGLHALTDAVLGAIGEGDIGMHFPPRDPRWRGASSDHFLRHSADLVRARGGGIAAVDVTIICERPKIGPHRGAMIERVAAILGIASYRVSVKATTTDRLGFTGRGEGIAAQAVATVRLPVPLPSPSPPLGLTRGSRGSSRTAARRGGRSGGRVGGRPLGLPFRHPAVMLATWFGIGLLPIAPGSWASLAALPFAWAVRSLFGFAGLAAASAVAFFGWWASGTVAKASAVEDPGVVVIDEIAGQWLVLLATPLDPLAYALAFLLFRVFDIWKPWPARWADRHVKGGLGIVLDDFLAAIYAVLVLLGLLTTGGALGVHA